MTQSLKGVHRPYQTLLVMTFDEIGIFYLAYSVVKLLYTFLYVLHGLNPF